jgi:hypothetical protein
VVYVGIAKFWPRNPALTEVSQMISQADVQSSNPVPSSIFLVLILSILLILSRGTRFEDPSQRNGLGQDLQDDLLL